MTWSVTRVCPLTLLIYKQFVIGPSEYLPLIFKVSWVAAPANLGSLSEQVLWFFEHHAFPGWTEVAAGERLYMLTSDLTLLVPPQFSHWLQVRKVGTVNFLIVILFFFVP